MRINARIEEEQAKQLESIKRTEHLTTTQVVNGRWIYILSKRN